WREGGGLKRRVRRVEMCGRVAERAREDRERGEERPELQRPRRDLTRGFAAGGAGLRARHRLRGKGREVVGIHGRGPRGPIGRVESTSRVMRVCRSLVSWVA